jgi:hypothetical protein
MAWITQSTWLPLSARPAHLCSGPSLFHPAHQCHLCFPQVRSALCTAPATGSCVHPFLLLGDFPSAVFSYWNTQPHLCTYMHVPSSFHLFFTAPCQVALGVGPRASWPYHPSRSSSSMLTLACCPEGPPTGAVQWPVHQLEDPDPTTASHAQMAP